MEGLNIDKKFQICMQSINYCLEREKKISLNSSRGGVVEALRAVPLAGFGVGIMVIDFAVLRFNLTPFAEATKNLFQTKLYRQFY